MWGGVVVAPFAQIPPNYGPGMESKVELFHPKEGLRTDSKLQEIRFHVYSSNVIRSKMDSDLIRTLGKITAVLRLVHRKKLMEILKAYGVPNITLRAIETQT